MKIKLKIKEQYIKYYKKIIWINNINKLEYKNINDKI